VAAIESIDHRAARIGPHEIEDDADGRRLASAVQTKKPENLATPNIERDVVERRQTPVRLGQVLELDRRAAVGVLNRLS
jgi:hypothetical protein